LGICDQAGPFNEHGESARQQKIDTVSSTITCADYAGPGVTIELRPSALVLSAEGVTVKRRHATGDNSLAVATYSMT
jgi:hypothetical protein